MNLISKKDLLAITGISYGQLYRWKRERLIPEEWFIKQSAYTGQETFFPREQILSRVKSILELKDKYSLEELARILAPEKASAKITLDQLREISELAPELLKDLPAYYGKEKFEFLDIVITVGLIQLAQKTGLTDQQMRDLLKKSVNAASQPKSTNITCTVFSIGNSFYSAFTPDTASISFDDEVEIRAQISLNEVADQLKLKYSSKFKS